MINLFRFNNYKIMDFIHTHELVGGGGRCVGAERKTVKSIQQTKINNTKAAGKLRRKANFCEKGKQN